MLPKTRPEVEIKYEDDIEEEEYDSEDSVNIREMVRSFMFIYVALLFLQLQFMYGRNQLVSILILRALLFLLRNLKFDRDRIFVCRIRS
jgi:hypothetical protein